MPTHTSSVAEQRLPQLAASPVGEAWREGSGSHFCFDLGLAGASGCGRRLLMWHRTDRGGQTCLPVKKGEGGKVSINR